MNMDVRTLAIALTFTSALAAPVRAAESWNQPNWQQDQGNTASMEKKAAIPRQPPVSRRKLRYTGAHTVASTKAKTSAYKNGLNKKKATTTAPTNNANKK
jgi:hypothetical protein